MSQSLKVWSKFSSKTSNGNIYNFRIVDMPDGRFEEVADLMKMYFVREETIFKASGVPESNETMKEYDVFLRSLWDAKSQRVAVCCIDDGTENVNDIIAASIMAIATKDGADENLQPQTKEMKKLTEIMGGLFSKFDTLKAYGLDTFYDGRGIVVHPKFRRLGITRKFMEVRRLMCKEHGIHLTGGWMTSIGAQKAAERDGWETKYEVASEDIEKQYGVTFKDVPPIFKYMIGKPDLKY